MVLVPPQGQGFLPFLNEGGERSEAAPEGSGFRSIEFVRAAVTAPPLVPRLIAFVCCSSIVSEERSLLTVAVFEARSLYLLYSSLKRNSREAQPFRTIRPVSIGKSEIEGRKLSRDWVILGLDYQRKRRPKWKVG